MMIFAFRRERLNVGSTGHAALRGRRLQLGSIAAGVLERPAIADQIPNRASGRLPLRGIKH
jgi:hypothetical protein